MQVTSPRRVALALAVPVLLMTAAVFATSSVQRNAAQKASRSQAQSQHLLTSMLDQETGARGYFQTVRPSFLQPWTLGSANYTRSLAELRRRSAGDSDLERAIDDQARLAGSWHSIVRAEILTLRRTGRTQSVVQARRAKAAMDRFRASQAKLDVALAHKGSQDLSAAKTFSVLVAASLALFLVALGLLIARRTTRREARRERNQSDLRELLQVSDSERESRGLLIRHIEKIVPGVRALVLNRNNSDDRLEVAAGDHIGSPLGDIDAAQLRPRSCLAVRLTRPHGHHPGDDVLLRCEICGDLQKTTACEPLLVGGQVIGSVLAVSDGALSDHARTEINQAVTQATPILANQRNLMLAETRAASDALTGLPNRRAADETLKRMAVQAGRNVSPLAAILLDLDHFKLVNDRHGHESGDKALAVVGRVIGSVIRGSDFAARFGGEEFLILLPDTDTEGAVKVAEKLRIEVERSELTGIGSITASFGVAVLPVDAIDGDELLRKADRALYAAKENGRNQVHAHTPTGSRA